MRRSRHKALSLWMNGDPVGAWSQKAQTGDALAYDAAWVDSPRGRPLSVSLEFLPGNRPHRGDAVRTYFENLLPDSKAILDRVARRFQTGSTDAFTLLGEVGRDCVGALQLLPETTTSDDVQKVDATPLTDADVARLLRNTLAPAVPGEHDDDEDFRISLAGAQEKSALLWFEGGWCRPHGTTPTSHILKLPLGLVGNMQFDMRDSAENEWLCSEILHAYGLPVARTQCLQFEDMKVLAVERFDREWATTPDGKPWLKRLAQEDICQARAVSPLLKYEADGGPGMDTIMALLSNSVSPTADRRTFFEAQLLFWMLRATDGHAKNFSIFLHARGEYRLAPLYDVLSAWPFIGNGANMLSPFKARMAMAVRSKNAHWKMNEIQRRHWLAFGARHGVVTADGRDEAAVIDSLIARTPAVVKTVGALLPKTFPSRLAESIFNGLEYAAATLAG